MSEFDNVAQQSKKPAMARSHLAELPEYTNANDAAAGENKLIGEAVADAYRPKGTTPRQSSREMALFTDDKKRATPVDDVHLSDAQKLNENERINLKTSLEKEFKVSFVETGFITNDSGKKINYRPANPEELNAWKQALTKAEPAQMVDKEKGIKIVFLEGTVTEEDIVTLKDPAALNDHGTVTVYPYLKDKEILEREGIFGPNTDSLSDTFRHEIAHTPDVKPPFESGIFDDDFTGEEAKRYGYYHIADMTNGYKSIWVQEGKDGQLYKQLTGRDGFAEWLQCDQDGQPRLDENGKQTIVATHKMPDLAKISPVSEYFTTPYEKKAEAMACLYKGGISRAHLYVNMPELYKLVVEDDQKMIDEIKGQGKFMRNPAGGLMVRTPENEAIVIKFQKNAAAMIKASAKPEEFG